MILFPYKKIVIETELSEEVFITNLSKNLTTNDSFYGNKPDYFFAGNINPNSKKFKILLNNKNRRDQKIIISGSFNNENTLEVSIRWSIFGYLIFLYVLFFSILALFLAISMLLSNGFQIIPFIISVLFFFLPIFFLWRHNFEKKFELIISKILEISNGKLCKK